MDPDNDTWELDNLKEDRSQAHDLAATVPGKLAQLKDHRCGDPEQCNGVLDKLGANSGGLTCFVEDGVLCYEYNGFVIQRTKIRAKEKLPSTTPGADNMQTARVRIPSSAPSSAPSIHNLAKPAEMLPF